MQAIEQQVQIINKLGLHARAATKFAGIANKYVCSVKVDFQGKVIDGKSIMALMLLAAAKGSEITLITEGEDAQQALDSIATLINNKFDEEA
ncbi:MAG: phosphocarrier protein HPr [Alteromonadaceae bacterium]|nr:MAG: phosphocarrier protein HPr [Alteromonadaceae bacterium]